MINLVASSLTLMSTQVVMFEAGEEPQFNSPENPVIEQFQAIPEELEGLEPTDFQGQFAGQSLPSVGRSDLGHQYLAGFYEGLHGASECPAISYEDPLDVIVSMASEHQIVVINEGHHQPYHRYYIARLAERLAEEGYDVYAAEAFRRTVLENREPGQISVSNGQYIAEPAFARGLRDIEQVGYDFVPYEIEFSQQEAYAAEFEDPIDARENAQSDNLIERVLEQNPEARILVHVGHSHVFEKPLVHERESGNIEQRWFASYLKEKTGIDPLTIEQTDCVNAHGSVIADGSETRFGYAADVFLAHPAIKFEHNRPTWRREIGDIEVAVPEAFLDSEERIIIEARAPEWDVMEAPVERLMLLPGEIDIPLLIPPGDWVLTAWTQDGAYGEPMPVTVQAAE